MFKTTHAKEIHDRAQYMRNHIPSMMVSGLTWAEITNTFKIDENRVVLISGHDFKTDIPNARRVDMEYANKLANATHFLGVANIFEYDTLFISGDMIALVFENPEEATYFRMAWKDKE